MMHRNRRRRTPIPPPKRRDRAHWVGIAASIVGALAQVGRFVLEAIRG